MKLKLELPNGGGLLYAERPPKRCRLRGAEDSSRISQSLVCYEGADHVIVQDVEYTDLLALMLEEWHRLFDFAPLVVYAVEEPLPPGVWLDCWPLFRHPCYRYLWLFGRRVARGEHAWEMGFLPRRAPNVYLSKRGRCEIYLRQEGILVGETFLRRWFCRQGPHHARKYAKGWRVDLYDPFDGERVRLWVDDMESMKSLLLQGTRLSFWSARDVD